jgi:hypothetical protein
MLCSFSVFRYSRIKYGMSFNAGVAFFIFLLLASNSFSQTIFSVAYSVTCSPSDWCTSFSFGLGNGGASCSFCGSSQSDNVPIPAGCTAIETSCSHTCSKQDNSPCVGTGCGGGASGAYWGWKNFSLQATVTYQCDSSIPPPLLPCSRPSPVSDSRCKGGQGLWRADQNFSSLFGNDYTSVVDGDRSYWQWSSGATAWRYSVTDLENPHLEMCPSQPNGVCPFDRPDGSSCTPDVYSFVAYANVSCPLGFADSPSSSSGGGESSSSSSDSDPCPNDDPECVCAINPNSLICQSSSSSSDDGSDQSSSSVGSSDLCIEFPNLPQCECQRNPSLPWCSNFTSSSGSDSSSGSNSPANDLCTDFPHLIFCQSSDSGSGSSGGSNAGGSSSPSGVNNDGGVNFGSGNGGSPGNGNDPDGVTCLKNNSCNWARIDVQLEQLGVERDTRNLIKDIVSLQQAGYNLTNEQNILLHSTLQAVNSGSADIVNAIDRLASRINSADSSNNDNFNSSLTAWGDMLNKTFGDNGSKLDNISSTLGEKIDGLKDWLGSFFGSGSCEGDDCNPAAGIADTSGLRSKANSMISGGGKGFAPWTNSQIDALIPSKIASGQCPVIDKQLSFFSTKIPFHIDFNNLVKGSDFDWAKFMKACLLITVYFINTFSMIAIFRSGGHK